MTAYFPGGTRQWTLWPFRWWWYFIANWSYWVPQWATIRVDSSPGALNIELYGMSAGDDVSGPTGDTEFPWGTMRVDFSSGAINIEQYDVYWWWYVRALLSEPTGDTEFPWGTMRADSSLGALNIEQYDNIHSQLVTMTVDFPGGTLHGTILCPLHVRAKW